MTQPTHADKNERVMSASRLEAFSDGVLAVIITIMVLELKAPGDASLSALCAHAADFLIYALSFANVGIYWNNHHHLLRSSKQISGAVMWANLNLLFWLSLLPFFTSWMGTHAAAMWPAFFYGVDLLLCAFAYTILQVCLIRSQGEDNELAARLGRDLKGKISLALYSLGIGLAFVSPYFADACYVTVAVIWFIPDRRLQ